MLGSAGTVKRDRITFIKRNLAAANQPVDEANIAENLPEQEVCVSVYWGGGGSGICMPTLNLMSDRS